VCAFIIVLHSLLWQIYGTVQSVLCHVTGQISEHIIYSLPTFVHWLLFIHKILISSTCFETQVLIFRRIQLYTCSIWYCHSLWEFLVACRYTAWVRTLNTCHCHLFYLSYYIICITFICVLAKGRVLYIKHQNCMPTGPVVLHTGNFVGYCQGCDVLTVLYYKMVLKCTTHKRTYTAQNSVGTFMTWCKWSQVCIQKTNQGISRTSVTLTLFVPYSLRSREEVCT